MSIKRGSIIRGPAVIRFQNKIIRTAGDIKLSLSIDTFDIPSSEFGAIDQRRNNIMVSMTFQPVGTVTEDMIPIYWPHLALPIGGSLFGATDQSCEIIPVTGKGAFQHICCAVTKMPDIVISATKTSIGEMTITAIVANNTDWNNQKARYEYKDVSDLKLNAIEVASIPTIPARISWGTNFTDLRSTEGVTVSFDMETNNEECDEDGIYDMTLVNISAQAGFTPLNAGVKEFLERLGLQGEGVLRGTSTNGHDLTIAAARDGGLKVVIPSARLSELPLGFGMRANRIDAITLKGFRTSGAAATIEMVKAAGTTQQSGQTQ